MERFRISLCTIACAGVLLIVSVLPAAAQLPSRVGLNVPWLYQILPGSSGPTTHTCGQSDAAMVAGYFSNYSPSQQAIVAEDNWLARWYGDSRYATPDSWFTNFAPPQNSLGTLLSFYWGLRYAGASGTNLSAIEQQVASGRPVIAGVTISNGVLSTTGAAHWVVVVGYDLVAGTIIVNDSGSIYGNHRTYTIAQFASTWATSGNTMAVVWR